MKERLTRNPRIQPRILILFLILGIPPLVFGHLILVNGAEKRFQEVVGTYFGQLADRLQTEILIYIEDVQVQIANLAKIPEIQAAARRSYLSRPSETEFKAEIEELEKKWPALTADNHPLLSQILSNEASLFLRDYNRVVANFREILVADPYGRLVAASGKTTDYFQADETWWRVAYLEGEGQRYLSDIIYDESSAVYSIEVAEPIRDESTRSVLGIIKGIVDSHEMFGLLDNLQFGTSSSAVLVRPDGSLATSPGSSETYPFVDTVFAELERRRRWVRVPEQNPAFLLGLPEFGVKSGIPELNWVLVVEAAEEDVSAPFQNLRKWYLYIVIFSVGLVIVLSLFFTWVLTKPIIETDTHLDAV